MRDYSACFRLASLWVSGWFSIFASHFTLWVQGLQIDTSVSSVFMWWFWGSNPGYRLAQQMLSSAKTSGQPWRAFFFLIYLLCVFMCVPQYIWRGQRKAFKSQDFPSVPTTIIYSSICNCLDSVQLLIMAKKNILMDLLSRVWECLQGIQQEVVGCFGLLHPHQLRVWISFPLIITMFKIIEFLRFW